MNDEFLHLCHGRPKWTTASEDGEEGDKEEAAEENKEDKEVAGEENTKDAENKEEDNKKPTWIVTDESKENYLNNLEALLDEGADINIQDSEIKYFRIIFFFFKQNIFNLF